MAKSLSNVKAADKLKDLPANLEAEQALLGALMINNDAFSVLPPQFEHYHFSEPLHRAVFEAAARLNTAGKVANPVTIRTSLSPEVINKPVGGMSVSQYLAKLCADAVNVVNAPEYAKAIIIESARRELIRIGENLSDLGFHAVDEVEMLDHADGWKAVLEAVSIELSGRGSFTGSSIAEEYLAMVTKRPANGSKAGVPIALPEIGTVLSERYFFPGRLYGLLSSSGEGKTSLTLQLIYHAIVNEHPVCFLSYDQSGAECVAQMIAQQSRLSVRHQQLGELTEKQIDDGYSRALEISRMPFQVYDCDNTRDTASKLAGYARSFVKRHRTGKTPMIVIDHIGTIKPDAHDRSADEGTKARNIGQQLKSLAKELNCPVLVLQQRSGAGMKRFNPRPIPQDLFGGETARQPFDSIFFLYRGEIHMKRQLDTAQDEREADKIRARFRTQFGDEMEGIAEIGALKVRFGSDRIRRKVQFEAELTKYISMSGQDVDQQEFF